MSNCFFKYAKNVIKLHRMIALGYGDGKNADSLREQMDYQWDEMSLAEQDVAKKISAILYELEEK